MRNGSTWILLLILPFVMVTSRPASDQHDGHGGQLDNREQTATDSKSDVETQDDKIISVRITSSIAVERGKGKSHYSTPNPEDDQVAHESVTITPVITKIESETLVANDSRTEIKEIPPKLTGANIEFIKQLHSKKEARGTHHLEQVHPFQLQLKNVTTSDTSDTDISAVKTLLEIAEKDNENIENIPLARSVSQSLSSQNHVQGHFQQSERGHSGRLTTVSVNIVHDTPKTVTSYEHSEPVKDASQTFTDLHQIYSEPPTVYSQPAKVYSEPSKVYSEPAKIYSEPAKVYSVPAKVYSEPAKIYSEPAKFYSPHASLNLPPDGTPNTQWPEPTRANLTNTTAATIPEPRLTESDGGETAQEIDKADEDDGDAGRQEENPEDCKQENCKVGYVVEGRQYRKYRVEERTADGFIVGEYGVVRHEDGALRGVRYTADGDASPTLIHDALIKFLHLK